jgi:hypothetical protein
MIKVKKTLTLVLLLALLMSIFASVATPISAKNLNLPVGANHINYFNAGGQAEVNLPSGLSGFPASATKMRLSVVHVEIPNADISFDNLLVWLYVKPTGFPLDWYPFAVFTDSADHASFVRTYFAGIFVKLDATKYYMNPPTNTIPFPASYSTDNVYVISDGTLVVDRHGNSISVKLSEDQQFKRPFTTGTYLSLPSFSFELHSYGDAIFGTETATITGVPGASGYTMVNEYMGFAATGSIISTGYLNGLEISNGNVIMHGTHTYFPPGV